MARPLLLPALAILACAFSCGEPRPVPARPNVLLVVADTLRADRLPMYGCERDNAPFLGELAERSLVFESAWSPAPWTVPATASLMTSVYPLQHGVVDAFEPDADEDERAEMRVNRLPDGVETLAEMFRDHGYRTFGVSANALVGMEMGFHRGFDRFVALAFVDADVVNAALFEWVDEITDPAATAPWFVYLHYFDPHDNYVQRSPWFDVAGLEAPDEDAASAFARVRGMIRREEVEDLEYAEELADWSTHFVERRGADPPEEAPSAAIDRMFAAYDSEIRFLDEHIRQAFARLDPEGTAAVVFTVDHGEELLDHAEIGHGQSLYNELVRVPLLVRTPGPDAPTGRVSTHVSTMDVLPTFRELLGAGPSPQDQGASLLGELSDDRTVFSMRMDWPSPGAYGYGAAAAREEEGAVVQGRDKLIFRDEERFTLTQLVDLATDPNEAGNQSGGRAARAAELRERYERLAEELPRWERTFGTAVVDDELRAALVELGYTGDD